MEKIDSLSVHACTCQACRKYSKSAAAEEHRAINRVFVTLDELRRRQFVGLLALQWGRGGIQRLIEITGMSRNTIERGRDDIAHTQAAVGQGRIRRPGGGRTRLEKSRLNTPRPNRQRRTLAHWKHTFERHTVSRKK